MKIVLASASPRRKELMQLITSDFDIRPSDFDESGITANTPEELVKKLAEGKALAAEYTADQRAAFLCIGQCGALLQFVKQQDYRNQCKSGDQCADRVEGKGPDMVHTHRLRHEGSAPDQGGEGQQQAATQLFFIHKGRTSFERNGICAVQALNQDEAHR